MIFKRCLKICDLYGTYFHWYISYKPKLYTLYGGIFTILSILLWILIIIFFGFNNFKRTHPIITTSTVVPKARNIKFGKEKIYLPWRIIDYNNKNINYKGVIYPKIYYYNRKINNTTGEIDTNYTLINYILCNETSMRYLGKEYLLNINLDNLYCIDMEDLFIGGDLINDFLNYIRLDLYLCENGSDYKLSDKCTSFDDLDKLYGKNNSIFFELLYPEVQFQQIDEKMPVIILYKHYYYMINKYLNKVDRIYLREYILEDEQGWIFNIAKNISYWGTYSLDGDNFIRSEKGEYIYKENSSILYSLQIYIDLSVTYYTRKYKKLYEIFSDIFPLIKIVSFICSFLTESINEIIYSKKLHELILDFNQIPDKKPKFNHFNILKEKGMKNYTHILKISDKSSILQEKENSKKISKNQNYSRNNSSIHNGNDSNLGLKIKSNKIVSVFSINDKNSSNKKIERIKYPLQYYLYEFIYTKLRNSNKFISFIPEEFNKTFISYAKLVDIASYIKLYKNFENVQKIVMNQIIKPESLDKKDETITSNRKRKISVI